MTTPVPPISRRTTTDRPPHPRLRRAAIATLCVAALASQGCGDAHRDAPHPVLEGLVPAVVSSAETAGGTEERVSAVVASAEGYWERVLGEQYEPLSGVYAYDAADPLAAPRCAGQPVAPPGNAYYCGPDDFIAYDEAFARDSLERIGGAALAAVIAHEVGHKVQTLIGAGGSTFAREIDADCRAGAWMGWIGESRGLTAADEREVVLQLAELADPRPHNEVLPDGHGSFEQRTGAFATGFHEGARACDPLTA